MREGAAVRGATARREFFQFLPDRADCVRPLQSQEARAALAQSRPEKSLLRTQDNPATANAHPTLPYNFAVGSTALWRAQTVLRNLRTHRPRAAKLLLERLCQHVPLREHRPQRRSFCARLLPATTFASSSLRPATR